MFSLAQSIGAGNAAYQAEVVASARAFRAWRAGCEARLEASACTRTTARAWHVDEEGRGR